jgi:hypothetical protein
MKSSKWGLYSYWNAVDKLDTSRILDYKIVQVKITKRYHTFTADSRSSLTSLSPF